MTYVKKWEQAEKVFLSYVNVQPGNCVEFCIIKLTIMELIEKLVLVSFLLIIIISVKEKIKAALPILLVVAGLVLSLIDGIPSIAINPDVIFYIVLPPLLFDAAWNTSWPDFKKEMPRISFLAIGVVLLSTSIIAVGVHYLIPGFSWPLAFALGAIVAPPDAVAAASATKGLSLPKRLTVILEGESLVNDASALVAYRYAVAAAVSGTFSFWQAGVQFIWVCLGGMIIGLVLGFLFLRLHRFLTGALNVETFAIVLMPFVAYGVAEKIHVSGVLAVVVLGMFLSWNGFRIFSVNSRMQMSHFWDVIIFVLNGFVFLLIGMQLPFILKDIPRQELPGLAAYGILISIVLVLVRWLLIYPFPFLSRDNRVRNEALHQRKKEFLILSWSGMRGVVSLAAALALPLHAADGSLLPQRNTILFITFVVILFTLIVQGLTLPKLITKLNPQHADHDNERDLNALLAERSIQFLDGYTGREGVRIKMKEKLVRAHAQLQQEKPLTEESGTLQPAWLKDYLEMELEVIEDQRIALVRLYKDGKFSLEAIRQKETALDFWISTVYHELSRL